MGAEVTIATPFFPDDRTMLLLVLKFKRHLKLKESKKKKKMGLKPYHCHKLIQNDINKMGIL